MDRYIGVDAHAATCTFGVIGPSGKRLGSMVVETNGRMLVDALCSVRGRRHVCLEEGTQSAWLYELFRPHADEVVVVVPPKRKGSKDDLRDAWKRADELRTGAIETRVYKAPEHLAAFRNAVRAYGFAVTDMVRAKNRLKSVFLSRGITADEGVYDAGTRPSWLKQLPASHRRLADLLGQQLDELVSLREEAAEWLLKESKMHPIVRTLGTAPGMGPIRTSQVVAIVADPHRFRTRRQFWSYCGLAVVTRSSSNWVPRNDGRMSRADTFQTRGLTRKRQPLLKAVFKGAATTVIQMGRGPLYEDYQRMLETGRKPNLAKLTLARRIAGIVLSMWKHQEVYDPNRQKGVADKE
jgi:transposase